MAPTGDALLETATGRQRIEPHLKSAEADTASVPAGRVEPVGLPAAPIAVATGDAARIDYTIAVEFERPVQQSALKDLIDRLAEIPRSTSVTASAGDGVWAPIAAAPAAVIQLRVALQLADRRGALAEEELVSFRALVTQWAQGLNATVNAPDPGAYVETARELDQFCTDADVAIGLNVVAAGSGTLSGTKLRGCLEAAGMRFERGAYRLLDAQGRQLFTVERQGGEALDPNQLKTATITGVTLLLDVPRVAQGLKVFDQLVETSKQLSTALGGSLVDDNRAPVTEAGLDQIRDQLRRIYAAMDARGIPAGSSAALRLFS